MANPRQKFVAWLNKHDPAAVEQLVLDLDTCSETAFADVCAFVSKLAQTTDIKGATAAAKLEVDKQPTKPIKAAAKLG